MWQPVNAAVNITMAATFNEDLIRGMGMGMVPGKKDIAKLLSHMPRPFDTTPSLVSGPKYRASWLYS